MLTAAELALISEIIALIQNAPTEIKDAEALYATIAHGEGGTQKVLNAIAAAGKFAGSLTGLASLIKSL